VTHSTHVPAMAINPESWEDRARNAGLDDLCISALKGVPPERAHQIINDLHTKGTEVRNPSAYVNKAAREGWDDNETLRRALETDIWAHLLDDTAKTELQKVDPACSLQVLADVRSLGAEVRNPSSYVCGTLRKRLQEGKLMQAAGLPGFNPMAAAPVQATGMRTATGPVLMNAAMSTPAAFLTQAYQKQASFPSTPSQMQRTTPQVHYKGKEPTPEEKAEIDAIVAELAPDLDSRAVERVYQLGYASEARKALEILVGMGDEVRNKSAFIHGVVAKRLQAVAEAEEAAAEAMAEEFEAEQEEAAEDRRVIQFEEKLKSFGEDLDEKAQKALREVQDQMGASTGLQLLKELEQKMDQGDLRNVSGFAYSMARTRLSGVQATAGNTMFASPTQLLEQEQNAEFQRVLKSWSGELDDRAQKVLHDLQQRLGTAVALGVLKELQLKAEKEEVRNASSFVLSMARQRLACMPQAAQAAFAAAGPTAVASANMAAAARQPLLQPRLLPVQVPEVMMPTMLGAPVFQPLPAAMAVMAAAAQAQAQTFRPTVSAPASAGVPAAHANTSRRWIEEQLVKYGLQGQLDDIVLEKMMCSQQERILEILQDMADKDDPVRNPSAFIQKSLKDFPTPRKLREKEQGSDSSWWQNDSKRSWSEREDSNQASDSSWWQSEPKRPRKERDDSNRDPSDPLVKYGDLVDRMDEAAVAKLEGHPDKSRVRDILAEMAAKIEDIRNPSAFVVRALNDPGREKSLGPLY